MLNVFRSVNSRRIWFVPDVTVWGMPNLGDVQFLVEELIDGTTSVLFGSAAVVPGEQEIDFDQLIDHRGNYLPASIKTPRVLPRGRDKHAVFIVGQESNERFRIARDPDAPGTVTTDLLIMEMGD